MERTQSIGKKIFAWVVTVAIAISFIPASLPDTAYAAEEVTISSANDLKDFADKVNSGESGYPDATVKVRSNIDMSDLTSGEFTSIGTKDNPFAGNFEGNNYLISNLTTSLFGYVASEGKVYNVRASLSSSRMTVTSNTGALGVIAANNAGTVHNCDVPSGTIEVRENQTAGGIVGTNSGTVSGPAAIIKIYGETGVTIGGIAGTNTGTVSACQIQSGTDITAISGNIGGIVGKNQKTVSSCTANGTAVQGTTGHIGGIVGYNYADPDNATITGCTSSVETVMASSETSASYVGGIAGLNSGGTIENSTRTKGKIIGYGYVGGIAGYSGGDIISCSNQSSVTTVPDATDVYYMGGIVGYLLDGDVAGCTNSGTIESKTTAATYKTRTAKLGGIAGITKSANSQITECSNTGKVTTHYNGKLASHAHVGGIVGENAGTVSKCTNTATVTAAIHCGYGGGLVGYNDSGATVKHSWSSGDVLASFNVYYAYDYRYIGGLVGYNHDKRDVVSSYCLGTITIPERIDTGPALKYNWSRIAWNGFEDSYWQGTFDKGSQKKKSNFTSGEVTWLLNGKSADGVWKQTLGTDDYPVFEGKAVYYINSGYYNKEETPEAVVDADMNPPALKNLVANATYRIKVAGEDEYTDYTATDEGYIWLDGKWLGNNILIVRASTGSTMADSDPQSLYIPRANTLTLGDLDKVYDGEPVEPNYTADNTQGEVTYTWVKLNDQGEKVEELSGPPKDAGYYQVDAKMDASNGYAGDTTSKKFSITARQISLGVTATEESATATITVAALGIIDEEGAGKIKIKVTNEGGTTTYYDETSHAVKDLGNGLYGVKVTASNVAATSYKVTATYEPDSSLPNYSCKEPVTVTFNKSLASRTITDLDSAYTTTYGDEAFALSPSVSAGEGSVTWEYEVSYDAIQAADSSLPATVEVDQDGKITIKNAGVAYIKVTATDPNGVYDNAVAYVKVKVDRKDLTVTSYAADASGEKVTSAEYGTLGDLTYGLEYDGLTEEDQKDPDNFTNGHGTLKAMRLAADTGATASGKYVTIDIQLKTNSSGVFVSRNYSLGCENGIYKNLKEGTLAVTPAELTVTAEDAAGVWGATEPDYDYTIAGSKLGETAAEIFAADPALALDTAMTGGKSYSKLDVGTYASAILASGGTQHKNEFGNDNYTLKYVSGTLTINQATGTIKITSDPSKTYDGKPVSDPTYETNGDGKVTFTYYSGSKVDPSKKLLTAPTKPGTYTVVASLAGTKNCAGAVSEPVTFKITKASGNPVTPSKTAVSKSKSAGTGDETNPMLYAGIMLATIIVGLGALGYRHRGDAQKQ